MTLSAAIKGGRQILRCSVTALKEHPMQGQDYYSILGIERSASDLEVRRAYRLLARRFHPDVSRDPDGENKFKAVAEAYRTLKSATMRTAYNGHLAPVHDGSRSDWNVSPLQGWFAFFPWMNFAWYWLG